MLPSASVRLAVVPPGAEWLRPAGCPVAQVWRGLGNEVLARGYAVQGRWWMQWPGIGTFLLDLSRPETVLVPEPDVARPLLEDAFRRGATPLVLLQREYEVLHASAVSTASGVVAFCAMSGTGKSTLAAALAEAGCQHWADDFVGFGVDEGVAVSPWFPSTRRLDDGAATAVGAASWRQARRITLPSPAPLLAIAIVEREDAVPPGEARVVRIPAGRAFTAVLPHAHDCHIGGPDRVRRSLERYLDVCGRVPVYHLTFAPDLGRVRQLAASVVLWLNSLSPPPQ